MRIIRHRGPEDNGLILLMWYLFGMISGALIVYLNK